MPNPIELALARLSAERAEKLRDILRNIPWNAFSERHSIFITLFLISGMVGLISIARVVVHGSEWSFKMMGWHMGLIMLYGAFAFSVLCFRKWLALFISVTLFGITFLLVGIYPFNKTTMELLLPWLPLSTLLPLAEAPTHVLTLWQFTFNLFLAPLTAVMLLFHRSLEIYFNPYLNNDLQEMLLKRQAKRLSKETA